MKLLMASANINCPLLDLNSDFPGAFNFGPNTAPPELQNMGSELLDLPPLSEAYANQELSINVYDNDVVSPCLSNSNVNKAPQQNPPRVAAQALSKIYGVNENMLQWSNENFARMQINMMQIPEEQLTVNVDADEGSMHSWRPGLMNSLTSDVFVAQPGLDNAYQNEVEAAPQLFLWDSPIGEECVSEKKEQVDSKSERSRSYPRDNVQDHLQIQRTQLNCLKYEVINAKRRMHEIQDIVAKLSCDLEEKLLFKNSKEMKTLREENAALRLECQCLCTEVDYYLRGKAPLGETDEAFWKSLAEDNRTEDATPPQTQPEYKSEEQEEANKWECPKCTFANHPAISCCEMCHMSRIRVETTQLHSSGTCFCHPNQVPNCS